MILFYIVQILQYTSIRPDIYLDSIPAFIIFLVKSSLGSKQDKVLPHTLWVYLYSTEFLLSVGCCSQLADHFHCLQIADYPATLMSLHSYHKHCLLVTYTESFPSYHTHSRLTPLPDSPLRSLRYLYQSNSPRNLDYVEFFLILSLLRNSDQSERDLKTPGM